MKRNLLLKKQMGERIRKIRNELKMTKDALGKKMGLTGQFLGVVESGKSTLTYEKLKILCDISGYTSDYILFGKDSNLVTDTKENLKKYTDEEIEAACEMLKNISIFIKTKDEDTDDSKSQISQIG